MTKPEIMKQLEAAVDEGIATRMWGMMKITWRDGEPETLRIESTRKFNEGGHREQRQAARTNR
jgi:hypothetical protein